MIRFAECVIGLQISINLSQMGLFDLKLNTNITNDVQYLRFFMWIYTLIIFFICLHHSLLDSERSLITYTVIAP